MPGLFRPPSILPVKDVAVARILKRFASWIEEADILIGQNFSKDQSGGNPSIIVPLSSLPDHTHSGPNDGGAQLGVHGGTIKVFGQMKFLDATAPQVMFGDGTTTGDMILGFYGANGAGPDPAKTIINFGQNNTALGGPVNTADNIGCPGARLYLYKDINGTYDACYGQSFVDNWVMPGAEDITYSIFTGGTPPFTPFLRAQWAGNGDYTNYGYIRSRKNVGGTAGPYSAPGLLLEETGAGLDSIRINAPASVSSGGRTQTLLNMTGSINITGNDVPPVAAGAMGYVDNTGVGAAVAATNLTNGALSGMYVIDYHVECTTANAGATPATIKVNYTDAAGATQQVGTALVCTATGRVSGSFVVYRNSGEISYQVDWTTPSGAAIAVRARVTYLG